MQDCINVNKHIFKIQQIVRKKEKISQFFGSWVFRKLLWYAVRLLKLHVWELSMNFICVCENNPLCKIWNRSNYTSVTEGLFFALYDKCIALELIDGFCLIISQRMITLWEFIERSWGQCTDTLIHLFVR